MARYPEEKQIREKCTSSFCKTERLFRKFNPNRNPCVSILAMDEYGVWDDNTGWNGEIYCTGCHRRVVYVGHEYESKAKVEKKLRKLWHVANEEVE